MVNHKLNSRLHVSLNLRFKRFEGSERGELPGHKKQTKKKIRKCILFMTAKNEKEKNHGNSEVST